MKDSILLGDVTEMSVKSINSAFVVISFYGCTTLQTCACVLQRCKIRNKPYRTIQQTVNRSQNKHRVRQNSATVSFSLPRPETTCEMIFTYLKEVF